MNFAAGPAAIPMPVLGEVSAALHDVFGLGMSILELNHRSEAFTALTHSAVSTATRLLAPHDAGSDYDAVLMQGGATAQFAAIPMQLLWGRGPDVVALYLVSGEWSAKAAAEAEKYGRIIRVDVGSPRELEDVEERLQETTPGARTTVVSYVYYCSNETIRGYRLSAADVRDVWRRVGPNFAPAPAPLHVCDASSDFLTGPADDERKAAFPDIMFGGTQKNAGTAGVTVVLMSPALRARLDATPPPRAVPSILDYVQNLRAASALNTPPVYAIYVLDRVLAWAEREGGISEMRRRTMAKFAAVMHVIHESRGFYVTKPSQEHQSFVNIAVRILGGVQALENDFLREAAARNMIGLTGHRSVGGIRISLYNGVTIEQAQELAAFMREFQDASESEGGYERGNILEAARL